jgi:peptidoglycan/xylan/chitin deacetylase (PgdA/CDA1 family)
MIPPRQKYYSLLAGFRSFFKNGVPVLMYHKVGSRPAGVVRRGLYVSAARLRRQLAELRAAGFSGGSMDDACAAVDNGGRRVVVTFDDGFQNVLENALAPLAETGFRAIQYLVPGLLGKTNAWDLPDGEVQERLMDAAQVRKWLAAGHEIGAHSMMHPNLCEIPTDRAREEIFASKKSLEDQFGVEVRHFCYPYGVWNERVRDFVAEAGFSTACTTQPGVNTTATPPFEIARYTARHPSPRPKEVLARLLDRMLNP